MANKQPTMSERIEELRSKRAQVEAGGGEKRHAKQHEQGKLTARERVEKLVDTGSFDETGLFTRNRTTLFGSNVIDIEGKTTPQLLIDEVSGPQPTRPQPG